MRVAADAPPVHNRRCQFLHRKSPWRASGCEQYVKSHYATTILKVLFLAQLLSLYESSKHPCFGKQADQSLVRQVRAAAALMTKLSCVAADRAYCSLVHLPHPSLLPCPIHAQEAVLHNRL